MALKKAEAKQAKLKMAFYGSEGTGKTLTALSLAEFIAKREGKRVAYIDTERGTDFYVKPVKERKIHPEAFDIDALYTRSLMEVLSEIRQIDPKQYAVVVIDSVSHLWEAAKEAYTGPRMKGGQIPIQAWGPIKRPYKQLMAALLDGDYHVIICGRESVVMEEDEVTGEVKVAGARMKSEGETGYEVHLLAQMSQHREKKSEEFKITMFVEKDRSGILAGKVIVNPTPEVFVPVLALLSGSQGKMGSVDDAAEKDAAAIEKMAEQEEKERTALFDSIKAAINGADSIEALRSAWALTAGKKKKLGEENYEKLEQMKDAARVSILGKVA